MAGRLGGPVAALLTAVVAARTDGNALFMVNIVEHLVQQGVVVRRAGQWTLREGAEAPGASLPEGLRVLLLRRIEARCSICAFCSVRSWLLSWAKAWQDAVWYFWMTFWATFSMIGNDSCALARLTCSRKGTHTNRAARLIIAVSLPDPKRSNGGRGAPEAFP